MVEQRLRAGTSISDCGTLYRSSPRFEDFERLKVADGYKHVYNSEEHPDLFLGTDTPINPGELNWQELQKVQLEDY